jgi:hypothetical protein
VGARVAGVDGHEVVRAGARGWRGADEVGVGWASSRTYQLMLDTRRLVIEDT